MTQKFAKNGQNDPKMFKLTQEGREQSRFGL
jgi:hypothetical protein